VKNLQERLAKLAGGVAVIRVGAATETEMKEKKDRIDDALHATRAAVEEGIVAGGGTALIRAKQALESLERFANVTNRLALEHSVTCVGRTCSLYCNNAGESADVVINQIKTQSGNHGYNAATRTSMVTWLNKVLLILPKLPKQPWSMPLSIAGLILTTDCSVAQIPQKEQPAGNPGMGGMGGMM
jgi:chaperonin GroEL